MGRFSRAKELVLSYYREMDSASAEEAAQVVQRYAGKEYRWYGVYPFRECSHAGPAAGTASAAVTAARFWQSLKRAVHHLQRRQDIFFAGINEFGSETWVMSMGHFMGISAAPWLDIPPTGRIVNLRYAEFSCVEADTITRTGLFVDLIGFMQQAGVNPLPPATGVCYTYPGPREHDGLLFEDAPEAESRSTLTLIDRMVDSLSRLNLTGSMTCPPELLTPYWSDSMIWYGPAGIGASYTIPGYQLGHQLPFRASLADKSFVGHVCRIAEGRFASFFGWPNLTNSPLGGWLGLPGGSRDIEMQVVDIYACADGKISENWVFIDIPYWLKQQGLDVLERMRACLPPLSSAVQAD